MAADANAMAASLLKNTQFMECFQRALTDGDEGQEAASAMLREMPKEGDPKREAWLRSLQKKLQQESIKSAKSDLEQVHTDENGQWMYILPDPGFCIKCFTSGGGKVFINVCQHPRIGEPVPMQSNSEEEGDNEIRFKVPISCGQARPDKDKNGNNCKVYDVIVNPATVDRCGRENEFRRFVAALCLQWIKQKSEPTLNAEEFRNLNIKAKGTVEPQRIRLSSAPPPTNAMQSEIQLPPSAAAPTVPLHTSTNGNLIEELDGSGKAAAGNLLVGASSSAKQTAAELTKRTVLSSNAVGTEAVSKTPSHQAAAVLHVEGIGSYDWSTHAKPFVSPFFREAVPAVYEVVMYIPNVSTIKEVDVRVSPKKVECFYIDEDDEAAQPFLSVVFDYPVSEDILDAKFVKKTGRLKMHFSVRIPDECAADRTRPSKDAAEEEAEEAAAAQRVREEEHARFQEQQRRQEEEEARVLQERKDYVSNLAAVQSGDIPPIVRDEVDGMPADQLPPLLARLEGRILKQDSVDVLIEKLPAEALDALCAYIRNKLGLVPTNKKKVSFSPVLDEITATPCKGTTSQEEAKPTLADANGADEEQRVEYNYARKAEKLFGVEFHNRYLFALDN